MEEVGINASGKNSVGTSTAYLVYSDGIKVVKGADKLRSSYGVRPTTVKIYTQCCHSLVGMVETSMKKIAFMFSDFVVEGEGDNVYNGGYYHAGFLTEEQIKSMEGSKYHLKVPFRMMLKFMNAAMNPFNGHKAVDWVPSELLDNPVLITELEKSKKSVNE